MRLTAVLACALATPAAGQEIEGAPADRVAITLSAHPSAPFVHQAFTVRLQVSIDAAFARDQLIQPFRQDVDVPIQIEAAALSTLPGAQTPAPTAGGTRSLVLNGRREVASASSAVVGGRDRTVLTLERTARAERAGDLALAAPVVQFTYATRFRDDFVNGRTPEDPRDGSSAGEAFTIAVRPLPTAGRPADFVDAVGNFAVQASAEPRSLRVGEGLRLTLRIDGDGNLQSLTPPSLADLEGFHVRGQLTTAAGADHRTVVYDLAPLHDAARQVPSIELAFFDPATGEYDRATTAAIELDLAPPADGFVAPAPPSQAEVAIPGVDDVHALWSITRSTDTPAPPASTWLLAGSALGPWALLGLGLARRRARRRGEAKRAGDRDGAVAAFFAERDEPRRALAEFLAAHLHCSPAAVISRDLAVRLGEAGIEAPLAQRTATLLDSLAAERFGDAAPVDRGTLDALVEELAEAFDRHGRHR